MAGISRRRFLQRAAGAVGGVLTYGLAGRPAVWAAEILSPQRCEKWWGDKNCSNVQPSACGGSGCETRYSLPSGEGGMTCTPVTWSPNNQFYAQCHCQAGAGCVCQVRVCVCNNGTCACKLMICDCG